MFLCQISDHPSISTHLPEVCRGKLSDSASFNNAAHELKVLLKFLIASNQGLATNITSRLYAGLWLDNAAC